MAYSGSTPVNMSEEVFDYICTACDRERKTLEAVKYCVECKDYCCQSCTDIHKKVSLLFGHNLLDVGQGSQAGNQPSNLPEFPTERCCVHKGKIIDMYCEEHNSVGCYVCIATDHKSCPESKIFSVPDMLDVLFNSSDSQQTEARLKQMMDVMSTLSQSKGTQLEALCEAKEKATEQVAKFQKVIETMVRNAADTSRKDIEEAYKKVEQEILQDKRNIDNTKNVLQETDEKLTKAASNRAQRFVCSKLAQKHIKDAELETTQHRTGVITNVQISFHPIHALKDYIQGLHGIGKVQIAGKKRIDLYKLKSSKDINIRVSGDTKTCYPLGCCLILDHQLLVTDLDNQKLKRIDAKTMTVVDQCSLGCYIYGICYIHKKEVAVGCQIPNKIQFISIENKMMPTRKIDTSHLCYGITMKDGNLYVTDWGASLYVYDMNGTLIRTITNDIAGNKLFGNSAHIAINNDGDKMFIGGWYKGIVCLDGKCTHISTIKDNDLNVIDGVCTDGRGNIFVVGPGSHNVVQYNEDGKKIGVVVKQEDGLKSPRSIAFHPGDKILFVTMDGSDVIKMFDLE
ncbi:hypothetical protein ACF0H5_020047 [Mactra antiquata]